MNCLLIHGGPYKPYLWSGSTTTSYTRKLVDEVLAAMREGGAVELAEIRLMDVNLPYCTGCMACFYKGEHVCPHAKLVQPIAQAMKDADCLILTSPVYALNVSALVKGFFDHAAYFYHRPSFFGKKALVISSTAGAAAKSNCRYMRDTLMHWGYDEVFQLPAIRLGATDVDDKTRRRCRAAGMRLRQAAQGGRRVAPSFKRMMFHQMWRNMARAGDKDSADHLYWQQSGLADALYAPGVPVRPPERAFGAMMNWVFHRVFREKGGDK